MTMLAGWGALLSRLSGQKEVVIGTPAANRGRHEIENLIGFFVNTLAMRVDLTGSPTVEEVLRRVKRQTLEAQENQDIPFEQVVEILQPVRSMAHSPLFQVMFAWESGEEEQLELAEVEVERLEGGRHQTATFDPTLMLRDGGGRIEGGVEYATSLYERGTVERYLGYYRKLLTEMVGEASKESGELGAAGRGGASEGSARVERDSGAISEGSMCP